MRLLFIRHGDPDYVQDTLTERGIEEAKALARIIPQLGVGDCYVSPLGRARKTAQLALEGTGIKPVEQEWLQEFMTDYDVNGSELLQSIFPGLERMEGTKEFNMETYHSLGTLVNPQIRRRFSPDENGNLPEYAPHVAWDMMPEYYTSHPELSDPYHWRISYIATHGGDMPNMPSGYSTFLACYDYVMERFDAFLAKYGYHRQEGGLYRTERGVEKTVTFFCHFGITAVLLSRLWNTSPFLLLQSMCAAPTSVTEVVTEERAEGRAYFRALRIGDTTHLTMAGIKPSFAARRSTSRNWPRRPARRMFTCRICSGCTRKRSPKEWRWLLHMELAIVR